MGYVITNQTTGVHSCEIKSRRVTGKFENIVFEIEWHNKYANALPIRQKNRMNIMDLILRPKTEEIMVDGIYKTDIELKTKAVAIRNETIME